MASDSLPTGDQAKVIRFFLDNPNSIDTPRGVSAWTNLSLPECRRILEELAKKGILLAYRTSSTVGYSLTENKKILQTLQKLAKKPHQK